MSPNKKVIFTLSIGYAGANHEDEFTLDQLGYDPEIDDLEDFLEQEWKEWRNNYLDGGWRLEGEE